MSAILDGEILRANGQVDEAIDVLSRGGEVEDGLRYDEPEPLNFSVWQLYGDAPHDAGRFADAEAAFRHEVTKHPHNGWSLFGLERALRAQGKDDEAEAVHSDFVDSWADADAYLGAPVY